MAAITCQGLTKHYGSVIALDNLDLNVEEGTIFGFLGPNGAGKSTTVSILTGLSKPTSGRAWVVGREVFPHSSQLQNIIGYLPEDPAFYDWMTGREYLDFIGEIFHLSSQEVRTRSSELLELVDLTDAASRRVGGYSRGMRQRLGIAQALVNRPAVLFLDEPCSALDPMGRVEILDLLIRLKEQKTTIFMSSHILADVERVCDTVGIINNGKLVIESGITELRRRFAATVFELEFNEPALSLVGTLEAIHWVQRVEGWDENNACKLSVYVTDMEVAKKELPGIVAQSGLTLSQYRTEMPTLENIFIELVGKKG